MDKLKVKYFFHHLIASLIFVISISLICQFIWFPSPFLKLDGTLTALLTLAGIDIIIGPLLTLLLVSSKKSVREKVIDLTIVLIIQIGALSYGLLQISQERIHALIYLNGAFNPVPIKEVTINTQNTILPKYNGIYYGTSIDSHGNISTTPLLFSPENYQPLTAEIIGKNELSYSKLSPKIQQSYSKEYIFKVLPGKQATAVVVMDKKLIIQDIVLL
jgi:hypothetical protein